MTQNILEQFSKLRALIIGDVMIDSYLWGKVDRISPEAPVPIVDVKKREERLGGAANVALNIQALGAMPLLCSVIGKDSKGESMFQLLKNNNLRTEGMMCSSKRITTTKFRILGNNTQMLRVDEEINSPLDAEDEEAFIAHIKQLLDTEKIDVIIFEDYDKGSITPKIIQKITRKANELRIPTTVDPKKRNFLYYEGVTLFKPNLKELTEGLNVNVGEINRENLCKVVDCLHTEKNVGIVFITLSEKGAFISDKRMGKEHFSTLIPAHIRQIADVSGAGDTVISVASLCLALGYPVKDIVEISNLAGGIVCEYVGVVPIDKNRLYSEIQEQNK